MFEKATRSKLRFDTTVGALSVEDLWDLPLTSNRRYANLDDVARALHRQLKNDEDVSFVEKDRKSDETIQLKFDIVRYVIDVRLAERAAEAEKQANAARKQKLLSFIADKEDDDLRSMSIEDLRAAVNALL